MWKNGLNCRIFSWECDMMSTQIYGHSLWSMQLCHIILWLYIILCLWFQIQVINFAKKCRTGTARACGFLWESAFCTPRPVHSVSCGTNSTKVPDSTALLCSLKRDKTWQHLDSGLQLDFGLKKHRARSLELFVKSHQSNPEVRWIPSTPITTCWSWRCWSPLCPVKSHELP